MNIRPTRQPSEGWRDRAACAGQDPRLFTDPRPGTTDTEQALATCRSCPVRRPCLNEALTHPAVDDVGIWGATTAEQRALLRHRQADTVAQTDPAPLGLFDTLDGDLTDLTGRALVTRLPAPPHRLLLVDNRPVLRTDDVTEAWHHLVTTIDDYQPPALTPFVLSEQGELVDPTGRTIITRLPTEPHLLGVHDNQPTSRHRPLADARQAALTLSPAHLRDSPARTLPTATTTGSMPRRARR